MFWQRKGTKNIVMHCPADHTAKQKLGNDTGNEPKCCKCAEVQKHALVYYANKDEHCQN